MQQISGEFSQQQTVIEAIRPIEISMHPCRTHTGIRNMSDPSDPFSPPSPTHASESNKPPMRPNQDNTSLLSPQNQGLNPDAEPSRNAMPQNDNASMHSTDASSIHHDSGIDSEKDGPTTTNRDGASPPPEPCPYNDANFISRLLFSWMDSLVWKGFKKPLHLHDLPSIRDKEDATELSRKFMHNWHNKKQSLIWCLHYTFGWEFYTSAFLKVIFDTIELVQPLLLKWIISFAEDSTTPVWEGWLILFIMICMQVCSFIVINQYFFRVVMVGKQALSCLRAVLYRKVLRLSNESRGKKKTGEIVNLMSTDSTKISAQSTYLHLLWSGLYQMSFSLIVLVWLLKWAALAGFVIIGVLVPLIALLSKYIQKKRREMLKFTDKRIGIINEILTSIRVIKYYVWEEKFLNKAREQRNLELRKIIHVSLVKLLSSSLTSMSPLALSMTSFLIYALMGNKLESSVIFPALSYYYLLRFPISLFPSVLSNLFEAKVSAQRIEEFLLMEEMEPVDNENAPEGFPVVLKNASFVWSTSHTEDTGSGEPDPNDIHNAAVNMSSSSNYAQLVEENPREDDEGSVDEDEVSISMPTPLSGREDSFEGKESSSQSDSVPFRLSDLSVKIPAGELTIIVGDVGSGKTSFLEALIGEMKLLSGEAHVVGQTAYCPQKPFIQNATVEENIIFGKPYNEERFNAVVEACALGPDLAVFPGGKNCELGSHGLSNISGGQQARISLARACYSEADIFLLDDVVSAVDSHVQKHIFQHCLTDPKVLGGKTRILVTHQLRYCSMADHIILLENGQIVENATYHSLMERKGKFYDLLSKHVVLNEEESQKEESENNLTSENDTGRTEQDSSLKEKKDSSSKEVSGKLVEKEERKLGTIHVSVYWKYVKAAGKHFLFSTTFFVIFAQFFQILSSWWLSYWSDSGGEAHSVYYYMVIYSVITIAAALFSVARDSLYIFLALSASKTLHSKALKCVLHAPVKFFNVNPTGRILNRFSKDISNADDNLQMQIRWLFNCLSQIISTLILIVIMSPFFLLPLVPILGAYYMVQLFYRRTSRELQRMLSNTRSPVFASYSETIDGVPTIRSFSQQSRFIHDFDQRLNTNMRPLFYQMVSQRWLGVRMEVTGRCIVWLSVMFVVLFRGSLSPGIVALCLTYSMRITGNLNWFIRCSVECENIFNSIERLLFYVDEIEQEPPLHNGFKPPAEWPQYGSIKFSHVWFKYRENLPYTLKDVSARIFGSEKIGICGKTGSGKSTTIKTLFRTTDISKGKIEIDDVDISKLGLADLRSILCILPQDPVLYAGTVRENLDPFSEYSDVEIWRALERAHMKDKIDFLEDPVTEFGGNFSSGEKQLLCLARGFLRQKARIVILDEASAMISQEIDRLLNETIQKEFQDKTMLIIAHRLRSIIWCDRIMVMHEGELAEFDSPRNLLSNPDSRFSALVRETGPANEKYLRQKVFGVDE